MQYRIIGYKRIQYSNDFDESVDMAKRMAARTDRYGIVEARYQRNNKMRKQYYICVYDDEQFDEKYL